MADEQQTLDQQTPEQPTGAAEDLTARVQELEEQLAAAQDQALRMVADLQNVRRRAEQDVEKAHKFALEKFAGDLLAVVDTLERGLEMSDPNDEAIKPMREGMELTLKMFDDTLRRYQVEALNPEGEPSTPSSTRRWPCRKALRPSRAVSSRCSRKATCSTAACCVRRWWWSARRRRKPRLPSTSRLEIRRDDPIWVVNRARDPRAGRTESKFLESEYGQNHWHRPGYHQLLRGYPGER